MQIISTLIVVGLLGIGQPTPTRTVPPADSLAAVAGIHPAAVAGIHPAATDSCCPAAPTGRPARRGLGWAAYLAVAAVGVTALVYAATSANRSP